MNEKIESDRNSQNPAEMLSRMSKVFVVNSNFDDLFSSPVLCFEEKYQKNCTAKELLTRPGGLFTLHFVDSLNVIPPEADKSFEGARKIFQMYY